MCSVSGQVQEVDSMQLHQWMNFRPCALPEKFQLVCELNASSIGLFVSVLSTRSHAWYISRWLARLHHLRRQPTRCRQRSPSAAFCRRQDVHRPTDPQQLRWPQLHCSRPMLVEQVAGASTTGHELRTLQSPTENISVCELVNHGALWLLLLCAIEVLLLTYLLTYLLT